jgi:hypothetical protein
MVIIMSIHNPNHHSTKIKFKSKKIWQLPTGHREHRDTVMDNRPKRMRTRKDIDKKWRDEYDI